MRPVTINRQMQQGYAGAPPAQSPNIQPQPQPQPQYVPVHTVQGAPQHQYAPQAPPQAQQPSSQQPVPQGPMTNQQMAQPQQQGAFQAADPNMILRGPEWPPELQGKTLREAQEIYNEIRQYALQRYQQEQGRPQGQPQAPNGQQPPQGAPQGQQPQGQQPRGDFKSLVQAAVAEALQPVMQQLQPVIQQGTTQQIESALNTVRGEFSDFRQLEASIRSELRNAPPELLANPDTYRNLYYLKVGQMARSGQRGQQPVFAPPTGQQPQYIGYGQPPQSPPVGSFFTEAPSAPPANQPAAYNPTVVAMAAKFGIPVEQYLAWSPPSISGGTNNGR